MPPSSPQDESPIRPHPLASYLIERLRGHDSERIRILDFAAGSDRNGRAIRQAGFEVVTVDDASATDERPLRHVEGQFTAAISTHGFLHGTAADIAVRLGAVAERLECGGLFFATFGSTRDSRFGEGERIDDFTYAPVEGDERGVAHAFFTRPQLEELLSGSYEIELLDVRGVDEIAGSWAHRERPLAHAAHWFVIARRR